MSKLIKFDALYNKIIFQSSQFGEDFAKQINDCDAFFRAYIQPCANNCGIFGLKARYNVFRVCGQLQKVFDFFKNFKVGKQFCLDINKKPFVFQIFDPLICFGEINHEYNNGTKQFSHLFSRTTSEGNGILVTSKNADTTKAMEDEYNNKIEGRWFKLFDNQEVNKQVPDYNIPKEVHACQPKKLISIIKKFLKENKLEKYQQPIYIEFSVNCDKLPNNCYGELAKQSPLTFGGYNNSIKDIADQLNNQDRLTEPSAKCKMPISTQQPVVNETKKIVRNAKKFSADTINKYKRKQK